jgi:hypothetical protein|nr:MAG TPA: AAA domain protein [Caudoviricetes sp.]
MKSEKISNLKVVRKNGTNEVWLNGEPISLEGLLDVSVGMPAIGKSTVHLTYRIADVEIESDIDTKISTEEITMYGYDQKIRE